MQLIARSLIFYKGHDQTYLDISLKDGGTFNLGFRAQIHISSKAISQKQSSPAFQLEKHQMHSNKWSHLYPHCKAHKAAAAQPAEWFFDLHCLGLQHQVLTLQTCQKWGQCPALEVPVEVMGRILEFDLHRKTHHLIDPD